MNAVAGIILAAGASERMGTPKALLDYHGETFVGRLTRILATNCDTVIVVLGNHVDDIRPHVPNRARVVVNPDPSRGQLSSLQCALAELPPDAAGFAFIPVDCPAVAEETVQQLSQTFAHRDPSTLFVIPRLASKRGHPVFATRAIADELLSLQPTDEARAVVHRHVSQTQYVEVADAGIFADIDTPEAYQRLLAEARK
ncbi:MAG: nucleotidyltransferase family protein [Acidobacteriota bacterium]